MTGLLVSVRSVDEAAEALAGGADIIDIKEPSRGSLGAADPATWRAIIDHVRGRRPVSAALGEITEPEADERAACTAGLQYAKLGLSGAWRLDDWPRRWQRLLERLAPGVMPVAVAYADWQRAAAPEPLAVLRTAQRLACRVLLVDTFDKTHGDLLAYFSTEQLRELAREVGKAGMGLALAGSLKGDSFMSALSIGPEWLAVRGAACEGGRTGRIDRERVARLSIRLTMTSRTSAPNSAPLA